MLKSLFLFNFCKLWVGIGLFLLLLIACSIHNHQNYQIVQAKPFNDTLQANIVHLNGKVLVSPFHIINLNNDYLLLTYLKENNFIGVYKLPDMQFLYHWGHQGKGPNEVIKPPIDFNHVNDKLIIYVWMQKQLRTYIVGDSTLRKKNVQHLSYSTQIELLNKIRRINDSLYFANYGRRSSVEKTNYEYIALRPDDKKPLFFFGKYPKTNLKGSKRYSQYLKLNVAKPNGKEFAAFYIHYNMFKIFNANGKLLKFIHIQDPYIYKNLRHKEKVTYRYVECATNKYIYTIGFYATPKKLKKYRDSFKTSLEIWNWQGQLVYRAKFDALINEFIVSEKFNKVYGLSPDSNNTIFEYNLPSTLNL